MPKDKDNEIISIDLRDLDLPPEVLKAAEEAAEKAVRNVVFNAGSRWGNVNWNDYRGGTLGMIGTFGPDRR